jgi:hypothetical protein
MSNFNRSHPEIRTGEVWLTNVKPGRVLENREDWESIGHKTKRLGIVAYALNGQVAENYKPVFVQKSELDAKGIKLKD